MINEISNVNDVKAFAKQFVFVENLSVHPDDDFKDYISYTTKLRFYSEKEVAVRNELMNQCFDFCNENNIEIHEIFYNEMKHLLVN